MEREAARMSTLTVQPRHRFLSGTALVTVLQLAGFASILLLLQIVGSAFPLFFATPVRIAQDVVTLLTEEPLLKEAFGSAWSLLVGMVISFVGGVFVGILIGRYRPIRVMLEPYLAAVYSVPRVAFVPLMVVWFGIGREFVIASVVLAASVVIAFATAGGVKEAELRYSEVARSFALNERQIFTKVLLPGLVPFIANGTRLAMKRGLTALIVAEFLIGLNGIGLFLRSARVTLQADRVFAMAFLVMLLGMGMLEITRVIENRMSRWRPRAFTM